MTSIQNEYKIVFFSIAFPIAVLKIELKVHLTEKQKNTQLIK